MKTIYQIEREATEHLNDRLEYAKIKEEKMKNVFVKIKFDMGGFNIDPADQMSKLVENGMIKEFTLDKDLEMYSYYFILKRTDLHYVMEQSIINNCTFFQFKNL